MNVTVYIIGLSKEERLKRGRSLRTPEKTPFKRSKTTPPLSPFLTETIWSPETELSSQIAVYAITGGESESENEDGWTTVQNQSKRGRNGKRTGAVKRSGAATAQAEVQTALENLSHNQQLKTVSYRWRLNKDIEGAKRANNSVSEAMVWTFTDRENYGVCGPERSEFFNRARKGAETPTDDLNPGPYKWQQPITITSFNNDEDRMRHFEEFLLRFEERCNVELWGRKGISAGMLKDVETWQRYQRRMITLPWISTNGPIYFESVNIALAIITLYAMEQLSIATSPNRKQEFISDNEFMYAMSTVHQATSHLHTIHDYDRRMRNVREAWEWIASGRNGVEVATRAFYLMENDKRTVQWETTTLIRSAGAETRGRQLFPVCFPLDTACRRQKLDQRPIDVTILDAVRQLARWTTSNDHYVNAETWVATKEGLWRMLGTILVNWGILTEYLTKMDGALVRKIENILRQWDANMTILAHGNEGRVNRNIGDSH
jgi:hypothetical protein